MTPADVQAHWMQELEIALFGKIGNTWERNLLQRMEVLIDAILSRPDVQALEALRDKWRERAASFRKSCELANGSWPDTAVEAYAEGAWDLAADDIDVLLHGAGGPPGEEKKDEEYMASGSITWTVEAKKD